jgi:hypothetical protein
LAHTKQTFTRLDAARIRAVAVAIALAAWSLPIAFGLLPFRSLRETAITCFALCIASLAASFLIGWSLYCPWCCKRLFFVASMANSPSLVQLVRLYLPFGIVLQGRVMCPHCHSRFRLARS